MRLDGSFDVSGYIRSLPLADMGRSGACALPFVFANGQRGDNLARCRRSLDAHHATANSELAAGHAKGDRQNNASDFLICPDCGGTMRRVAAVPHSSADQPFYCDTS